MPVDNVRKLETDPAEELITYCLRPLCRREFRQAVGRGRPRTYCSDLCRKKADVELRSLIVRREHYAALVDQLERDISAFQRDDTDPSRRQHRAQMALAQAEGALMMLRGEEEGVSRLLRELAESARPLINADQKRAAS
jgi:hypothetical protein